MGLIIFIGIVILMLSIVPISDGKLQHKRYGRSSRSKSPAVV